MPTIHPTAIVDPAARLADDVFVGPFCTVGPNVTLGTGTRLISHVVIDGYTTLGAGNTVYPFASLGLSTPDLKYNGEPTTLIIGDGNTIREYVNMHIGTAVARGTTVVGDKNLLMPGTHVAHDCIVGNGCIIANFVQLAGHVEVADNVVIGGLCGVHQFVRIGRHAIIGGHTAVDHDVPPYANVSGRRGSLRGLNLVGLRRRGFERPFIQSLGDAYTHLFDPQGDDQKLSLQQRAEALQTAAVEPEVQALAAFVLASRRGVTPYESDE